MTIRKAQNSVLPVFIHGMQLPPQAKAVELARTGPKGMDTLLPLERDVQTNCGRAVWQLFS